MIGFPLTIYHSPLPHTYTLSFLHRHPESYRPVTSAPTFFLIRIHTSRFADVSAPDSRSTSLVAYGDREY